jgi:hypothetical protein
MTLGPNANRLLELANKPLSNAQPALPAGRDRLVDELGELLRARNGFYAFEGALHVFASGDPAAAGGSLESWNEAEGWRAAYDDLAAGFLFFAEDVFGGQFAIRDGQVHTFDPETGEAEAMATSIEDWADQILADHEVLTGAPLASRWWDDHGPLPPGQRLVPRTPFVLGGEFELANVYALDALVGMRVRAELAVQIRDLPDGSPVNYRVVE